MRMSLVLDCYCIEVCWFWFALSVLLKLVLWWGGWVLAVCRVER